MLHVAREEALKRRDGQTELIRKPADRSARPQRVTVAYEEEMLRVWREAGHHVRLEPQRLPYEYQKSMIVKSLVSQRVPRAGLLTTCGV